MPDGTEYIRYACRRKDSATMTDADIDACKFMIERGTVASDKWVPAPEDLKEDIKASKIDALRSLVDDSRALRDPAFVDDIETFIKNDGQVFEIKKDSTGKYHVFMKNAFAERLVSLDAFIHTLETIDFTAQNATVGKLKTALSDQNQYIIAEKNYISICTKGNNGQDKPNVTIKGGSVPTISACESNGESGSTTYGSYVNGNQEVTVWNIGALKDGTTINVKTRLSALFSAGTSSELGNFGTATIKLMRNGAFHQILAQCIYPATTGTNNMSVDRSVIVGDGNYSIVMSTTSTDTINRGGNISPIQMSYNYLDNSNMSGILGDNGLVLQGNRDNYLHVSFDKSVMTLKAKGTVDMPGVLRAGRVKALGNIDGNSWGPKSCNSFLLNNATGQYKITHNIGHTDYYVTAILANSGFAGMVSVVEKQNNYVTLYVRGLDGQLHNVDFEFMICGRN